MFTTNNGAFSKHTICKRKKYTLVTEFNTVCCSLAVIILFLDINICIFYELVFGYISLETTTTLLYWLVSAVKIYDQYGC